MIKSDRNHFPALERPPIVEVVCGIVYDSIAELDALTLGVYWDSRIDDFPKRQLHPALSDGGVFTLGVMPMRAFLVSENDEFVLQLQHDRFFMNWRAVGNGYPRFSERHGPGGLLSRMEHEFELFRTFVRARLDCDPVPRRIELAKIDMLVHGRDWKDAEDLAKLVPVTGTFRSDRTTESRDLQLRYGERAARDTVTTIQLATVNGPSGEQSLRIDARIVTEALPTVREAFSRGDEILNEIFFDLVPTAAIRFGNKEQA